jgi:twinkle protein
MKGFEIISADKLQKDLDKFLIKGAEPGLKTGFDIIDTSYTVLKGGVTDLTGWPGSGKTLFLDDLLMSLSQRYGWKHLLYVPDSGNHQDVYSRLIHKLTGKTFRKDYDNQINQAEMYKAMAWVREHFHVLIRNDFKERLSPAEFWEYAIANKYDSAVIDSWNFMKHDSSRGTSYLAEILSYRNELAENNNIHFFTIIHPKNPTEKDYDKEGKLRPANEYTLMGGSEWNNNGKCIISAHKESKDSDIYEIHFRKIKPDIVGLAGGFIEMQHDWRLRRFYYIDPDKFGQKSYAVKTMFADKGTQTKLEQPKIDEQSYYSGNSFKSNRDTHLEDNEDFYNEDIPI